MVLSDWIIGNADFAPQKAALRFDGEDISYADLADRVVALARALHGELGVRRGDRLAWLGYNSPAFLAFLFAASRLGAIVVPLNWRLAPPEHGYVLRDAAVSALLVESGFREQGETLRASLTDCRMAGIDFADDGWPGLDDLVVAAEGPDHDPAAGDDDPVLLVYTSGTTGRPKGAVLTQSALFWNAVNSTHMHDLTGDDHVLTVLPMFHVGGLNIQTLPALHAGATVTLHHRFDPAATLRSIARDRPTLTVLVPATMQAMIEHPDWAATDLGSLRMITTGSTIVPISLIETFHGRGIRVIQVYGTTETAPVAVYLKRHQAFRKIGASGRPALHGAMRIVDDDGVDVASGARGEVLVKGPNVMREYWRDPVATAAALRDGWFHTGDIGHTDDEGFFYVDDRKQDVVISGGENIYPAELENVLADMPELAEYAVVGQPDARWGEVPVACVVLGEGCELSTQALLERFEGKLARYKHPREVRYFDELPRNAMGKVLKYQLREQLGDGGST